METLLIQLTNQKAAGLLHELEELQIIKVLKKNVQTEQSLSKKYAGLYHRLSQMNCKTMSIKVVKNGNNTIFD